MTARATELQIELLKKYGFLGSTFDPQELFEALPALLFHKHSGEYHLKLWKRMDKGTFGVSYERVIEEIHVGPAGSMERYHGSLWKTFRAEKNMAEVLASWMILLLQHANDFDNFHPLHTKYAWNVHE